MSAPGTSWQLMLADLSIILFLTSFSALAKDDAHSAPPRRPPLEAQAGKTEPVLAVAEPMALWRAGDGAPTLGEWLNSQAPDDRMRVNVRGGYLSVDRNRVLAEASAVSSDPALAGRDVRLILEPADHNSVTVTLSYDKI